MLYAATLELYLGTVYLFSAAFILIVLVITLYIYGYLNNLEKFSNSNNQSTILEANESLRGMSGFLYVGSLNAPLKIYLKTSWGLAWLS